MKRETKPAFEGIPPRPERKIYTAEEMEFGNTECFRDTRGRYRSRSLFIETIDKVQYQRGYRPIFSLTEMEYPERNVSSIYNHIVRIGDPTGYRVAIEIFGNWEMYQQLYNHKVIGRAFKRALAEVEVAVRSASVRRMRSMDNPAAQKWLADKGWEPKPTTKEAKKTEAKIEKKITTAVTSDSDRILKLVGERC